MWLETRKKHVGFLKPMHISDILVILVDSNLLNDVAYVLCLDSIGTSDNLYLHVSKPPREDTPGGILLQVL